MKQQSFACWSAICLAVVLVASVIPSALGQNGVHLRFVNAQVAYSDPLLVQYSTYSGGGSVYTTTTTSPDFTDFNIVLLPEYSTTFNVIDIYSGSTVLSVVGDYDSGYGSLVLYGGSAQNDKITPKYSHSVLPLTWAYIPELLHFPGQFNITFRLVNLWENTVTPSTAVTVFINGAPIGGNDSWFVGVGQYSPSQTSFFAGPSYLITLFDQDSNYLGQYVANNLQAGFPYDIFVLPTMFNINYPSPYPTIQVVPQSDVTIF
eukprot:TRINITY_DN2737_c0_g1_i1.p1 TRINITY_DN2737_c0_g1~~TRINITY_DN2737_c0_g1_i1.p1  ORF type:complete len:276 (-),score=45.05 TRINITY_DN2737_c0_g1_i1:139-921(-)